jgi:hypothetical protein
MGKLTMGIMVQEFLHHISELELDRVILEASKGQEPMTTEAAAKYNTTRRQVLRTLDIMLRVKDPKEKAKVQRMRERFVEEYPKR